jgi:hypothetical protein
MPKMVHSYSDATPETVRQMSIVLGYIVDKAGGSLTLSIPSLTAMAEVLEGKMALAYTKGDNNTLVLTLVSIEMAADINSEDAHARAN